METLVYAVADMTGAQSKAAIEDALAALPAVMRIEVDLAGKTVTVSGMALVPQEVEKRIADAGYSPTLRNRDRL